MRRLAGVLALLALTTGAPAAAHAEGGPEDATVIAVIDSAMNPYHWDFGAERMPQHRNAAPDDDLPLDQPASTWLPGFDPSAFTSFERLDLSLAPDDANARADTLRAQDAAALGKVRRSTTSEKRGYWIPGTKVIGAMTWASNAALAGAVNSHGAGTTSSAVGNLHGTCGECLLFFIHSGSRADTEAAIDWAMDQPWIDAISNSYGYGSNDTYGRDRIYSGSNVAKQREASERGQTIFFSSGNGVENAFVVPNQTTFSSQEGPDWIVTVGAVSPPEDGFYATLGDEQVPEQAGPYLGAGKPADIAGVGSDYPTAYGAATVSRTGTVGFGGTSNATPQVAGTYGRALYEARRALPGASKAQAAGVVAQGPAVACGGARADCELGDGVLTAAELRRRVMHAAIPSTAGLTVGGTGAANVNLPRVKEETMLGEGHGALLGRVTRKAADWEREFARVTGPMTGVQAPLARPAGEREWFVVDSYCRQRNWGAWSGGDYVPGTTRLPGPDPLWPVRSAREQTCPGGPTPLPRP
jgi:hypothetical protein